MKNSKFEGGDERRAVLIVSRWGQLGGIEQVNADIARALDEQNWAVTVLCNQWEQSPDDLSGRNLRVIRLAPRLSRYPDALYRRILLPLVRRILYRWTTRSAEVVIFSHVNLLRAYGSCLGERRVWLWAHGIEVWGKNASHIEPFVSRLKRVVCVSDYTSRHVARVVPSNKIVVVPNCVDTELYRPASIKPQRDYLEILISGRIVEQRPKGHDILLETLKSVEAQVRTRVILNIVGEGNDLARLKKKAGELGLSGNVKFCGRLARAELVEAYQACDVFCMISNLGELPNGQWFGEGFGIVYLEAAACGRPVIISNVGGAPETIIENVTGFAVPPDGKAQLAQVLVTLLSDPKKADEMGRNGRRLVEQKFSFGAFAASLLFAIECDQGSPCQRK